MRTLAHVRKLFNWAAEQAGMSRMLRSVPSFRKLQQKGEAKRERKFTDEELRDLWAAAETLATPFRQYIQLLMLTAQRAGEIKGLEWPEITTATIEIREAERVTGREDIPVIEISGAKYKNGHPHVVPMTRMVVDTVGTLPRFEKCSYAVTASGKVPIDCDSYLKEKLSDAILKARRQAIEEAGGNPEDAEQMPDWRLHDIRRTVRTRLSKLGIAPDVGERVLGHVIGGVRGVYDQYDYLAEKRRALTVWERHLSWLIGRTGGDNVVALVHPSGEPAVTPQRPGTESGPAPQPNVASVQ